MFRRIGTTYLSSVSPMTTTMPSEAIVIVGPQPGHRVATMPTEFACLSDAPTLPRQSRIICFETVTVRQPPRVAPRRIHVPARKPMPASAIAAPSHHRNAHHRLCGGASTADVPRRAKSASTSGRVSTRYCQRLTRSTVTDIAAAVSVPATPPIGRSNQRTEMSPRNHNTIGTSASPARIPSAAAIIANARHPSRRRSKPRPAKTPRTVKSR